MLRRAIEIDWCCIAEVRTGMAIPSSFIDAALWFEYQILFLRGLNLHQLTLSIRRFAQVYEGTDPMCKELIQ